MNHRDMFSTVVKQTSKYNTENPLWNIYGDPYGNFQKNPVRKVIFCMGKFSLAT